MNRKLLILITSPNSYQPFKAFSSNCETLSKLIKVVSLFLISFSIFQITAAMRNFAQQQQQQKIDFLSTFYFNPIYNSSSSSSRFYSRAEKSIHLKFQFKRKSISIVAKPKCVCIKLRHTLASYSKNRYEITKATRFSKEVKKLL